MKFDNIALDLTKSGIDQFLLTGAKAWYEYKDGKRTDNQLGVTYEVAMPHRMLEKISVHVKDINAIEPKMQQVTFQNLQLSIYANFRNPNELGVSATADKIKEVK